MRNLEDFNRGHRREYRHDHHHHHHHHHNFGQHMDHLMRQYPGHHMSQYPGHHMGHHFGSPRHNRGQFRYMDYHHGRFDRY
jgi:hypothetical protein